MGSVGDHGMALLLVLAGCNGPLRPPTVAHEAVTRGSVESISVVEAGTIPRGDCPMNVPGTRVTVVPIENGAALIFTSATESSDALVRPVFLFATQYDSEGLLDATDRRPSPLPFRTQVALAETVAGARLEIQSLEPRRAEALAEHLRHRAALMVQTNSCAPADAAPVAKLRPATAARP